MRVFIHVMPAVPRAQQAVGIIPVEDLVQQLLLLTPMVMCNALSASAVLKAACVQAVVWSLIITLQMSPLLMPIPVPPPAAPHM